MRWTLRRVAAVSLLAILGLILTAPAVEAAGPRTEAGVPQTLAKLADWNDLAAQVLAWLGLGEGASDEPQRIAAPSGSGMDPNGGMAASAAWQGFGGDELDGGGSRDPNG